MTDPPYRDGRTGGDPDGGQAPGPGDHPLHAQPPHAQPPHAQPLHAQPLHAQPPHHGQQPAHGQPGPWGQQPGGPPHGATQPYTRPPGGFGQPASPPQPWGPPQWGAPPASAQHYGRPPGSAARPYGGPGHGAPGYGAPGPGATAYGATAYGVPPFGAPGQPPTRRGLRWGLLAVLAAVVVAGVGVAVLATGAGPTVLSRTAVERDVAVQFEQREGVAVGLDCAEEMTVEEGATYECTGVTADDEQITLRIEITHEDGARYTWTEP